MRLNLLAGLLALVVGATFAHAGTKGHHLMSHKANNAGTAVRKMKEKEPLTVTDVLALHNRGKVSDKEILNYIEEYNYSFDLTSKQLAALKKSGVHRDVVDYILMRSDLYTFEKAHYIGRDYDPLYTQMDPRQSAYADYPWHYRLYPQNRHGGIGAR